MNRQILLASKPVGMPKESDFRVVDAPMPQAGDGQVVVKTAYWSVDPYMRGRITGVRSYADPVLPGELMVGGTVGQVVESKSSDYRPGDYTVGYWGWQEYAAANNGGLMKLSPDLAPVTTALGVLGMPGMTAYFGFLELCQPKAGETVVVSGAAGAVGSAVGQIARIKGCRVVGIAGGEEKVRHIVDDLGFDAGLDYKQTDDYAGKLGELCPTGVDCYFDNVGGRITDDVFRVMNVFGRVSVCGQISMYNQEKPEPGPRFMPLILTKQLRVEGFIVTRFMPRFREGGVQMATWLKEGKLKYREQIVDGFENIPGAFIALLEGQNIGKMLVRARS
jgi:NADPH-dependent curcumin reductase CurA